MSEIMWGIYRLFNEPPGTPRELKCVGCKVASAAGCLTATGVSFYMSKRHAGTNGIKSFGYGGAGFLILMGSFLLMRLAYDNKVYNEHLTQEHAKEIRRRRLESRDDGGGGGRGPSTEGCPVMGH